MVDDWADVLNSQIHGGFALHSGSGHFILEDSTFFQDVDVSTANHGPVYLSLSSDHFLNNLKLETHDANPGYYNPSSYQLYVDHASVLGGAEIHNGVTDQASLWASNQPLFPIGMSFDHVSFNQNLELDIDSGIGKIQFSNAYIGTDFTINMDHSVNRFESQSTDFHGGFSMQADHNEAFLSQLHMENTSVDWDAVIETADHLTHYGPIIPFD